MCGKIIYNNKQCLLVLDWGNMTRQCIMSIYSSSCMFLMTYMLTYDFMFKLLIVCFVDFFLEFMFLSLLGLHLNIESHHACLIYAFHTKNMQVPSDMVKQSSKLLHYHYQLFQRKSHPNGLLSKFISILFNSLSPFLSNVFPFYEFLFFVADGIKL